MDKQLPGVQELFAEAFIELQKEIGEESARFFQSAANADDPLAMLLDDSTTPMQRPSFRKPGKGKKKSTKQKQHGEGDNLEGGFIREAVLPERLRKLQKPNVSLEALGKDSSTMSRKRPAAKSNVSAKKPFNPYQRKQNPPQNMWNHILDSNNDTNRKKKSKSTWEDVEKEMISNITAGSEASRKTCTSCGSTNVEIKGNSSSTGFDMTKGEVWGSKDRAVVVERCRCLACGKSWNDE